MGGACRHETDLVLGLEHTVDDAHKHDHADIIVEPGVDDQPLQGLRGIALGRGNTCDNRFQDLVDAHAGLRAGQDGLRGVDADDVFDLRACALWIGLRQIHFVEHWHHLDAEFDRGVAVGDGLRLDTLRCVHDEQRALAGRERAADLIGEIHVTGGIDQVERVDLATLGFVVQRSRLRLDCDPAFALDIHRVENLRGHFAISQPPTTLDQPIREGGLAVVDMGNDGEITDVLHNACGGPCMKRGRRAPPSCGKPLF